MTHALGIDVGTTNAKVALVDDTGRLVVAAARPITTTRDGEVAEQNPAQLWAAVCDAVGEVVSAAPDAAADIGHIGVDSQYSSTVPVDAAGNAVGPLIMYLDRRGTDHCLAIFGRDPDAFMAFVEHHGIPPVGGGVSLSHMLYFQHDQPKIHTRTHAYLEPMDFVIAQLTGVVAANQCTQFTSLLCDNRTLGSTEYDPELLRMSGADPATLPPLRSLTDPIGTVRADIATVLPLLE